MNVEHVDHRSAVLNCRYQDECFGATPFSLDNAYIAWLRSKSVRMYKCIKLCTTDAQLKLKLQFESNPKGFMFGFISVMTGRTTKLSQQKLDH